MKKKKVNLGDMVEGETYQVLLKPIVFSDTDMSISGKNRVYHFGDIGKLDAINILDDENETVWEVIEGE